MWWIAIILILLFVYQKEHFQTTREKTEAINAWFQDPNNKSYKQFKKVDGFNVVDYNKNYP